MKTLRIQPAPGRRVRQPHPPCAVIQGAIDVPDSSYWRRRLAAGDVELVPPPAQVKAESPKSKRDAKNQAQE